MFMSEIKIDGVQAIINANKHLEGALLPILHGLQDQYGYIPEVAYQPITEALAITLADLKGVISFYHFFRTTPPAKHVIQVCRAEACQAMGGRQLEAHAKQKLGVDWHGKTLDQQFQLEQVFCLGNCACAPAVRVGDEVIGRVSPERFDALLEELQTEVVEVKL